MNQTNKWLLGTVSAATIGGVAYWEGLQTHAYLDIGGVPTVCFGYTGKDIDMNKIYTVDECRTKLVAQIQAKSKGVLECINVPIKQNEYDAYTIFSYNVGVSAFCNSSSVKALNAGNHTVACNLLANNPNGSPNWSYVKGKYIKGLQARRQYEKAMCLGDFKK